MYWWLAIVAVVVVGLIFMATQGHLGGMPPLVDDRPGPDLPGKDLTSDDVRKVRFAVTTRGYSMDQVDGVLDRLANQMDGIPYERVDDYAEWAGSAKKSEPVAAVAVAAEGDTGLGWPGAAR
jgi:DivIVA domain-containing protein